MKKQVMLLASVVASVMLVAGCSSTTTISPAGKQPVFQVKGDQTVTVDTATLGKDLEQQVAPLLSSTAGLDRVLVISYTMNPGDAVVQQVIDYVSLRAGPTDVIKVERDFLAHPGISVTVRDVKQSAYHWYSTQAVSDNFGHATARNLAQQAADPRDLEGQQQLDAPNPQAAVGAVERYQRGSVRPFGDVSLEAGGGKSK